MGFTVCTHFLDLAIVALLSTAVALVYSLAGTAGGWVAD
jgi:hypothetical protein